MKIMHFKDFVKLPVGTIFSYYEPDVFVGLWQKGKTICIEDGTHPDGVATDYFQTSLLPFRYMNDDLAVGVKERWGEMNWDQLYAVYEDDDVRVLRQLLTP